MSSRPSTASGRATAAALVLSTVVVAASVLLFKQKPDAAPPAPPLIVYCAVSLRAPVEALAKAYEQRYHTPLHLQFGASQSLMASIEISGVGDLYLPADHSYFAMASFRQLVGTTLPIARQHCLLMVTKGNPKNIRTLADLLRPEVRLALANPEAAAIGKLVRGALEKSVWEGLAKKASLIASTGVEAANAVKIDAADAAFIWDAMRTQYPAFDSVELPEITSVQVLVGVGVLTCSQQSAEAMKFARFLSARNTGLPLFKANGFEVVDGPLWKEER